MGGRVIFWGNGKDWDDRSGDVRAVECGGGESYTSELMGTIPILFPSSYPFV